MNDREAVLITGVYVAVVVLMAAVMLFTCMQPLPESVSNAVFPLTSINAAEPVPTRKAL